MITSVRNRQIVAAARLKKRGIREQHRRFLVEGAQATREAIEAGAVETVFHVPGGGGRVGEIVRRAGESGTSLTAVSESVMGHLTSTVTPQPIVAVASFVDVPVTDIPAGVVPVLCEVRDPGNAGTIVRASDASGAAGVVFTESSVDVYNPKTVRASAGSIFHLPVAREIPAAEAIASLRDSGARVVAAAADGRTSIYDADLTEPTAVLFGNESWGLPPALLGMADDSVRIPIAGRAESLNLAAAAALVLFEAERQRIGGRGTALASDLAVAAHDLRLPLVGIKGFAATLADNWDVLEETRRREAVSLIAYDAERGAALVELVVALGRIGAGRAPASAEHADLREVGRKIARTFHRIDERPDVRWSVEGIVAIDERLVHAILLVLTDIASSIVEAGSLVVTSSASSGALSVDIAAEQPVDPGPGGVAQQGALRLARRVAEAAGAAVEETPAGFRVAFTTTA